MRWLLPLVLAACTTRHEARNEWTQRPMVQTHGRVGTDALGYIDYSLDVPEGLSAADVSAPKVAIALNGLPPHDVGAARDAALAAAGADAEIVSAEAIPLGFRVDMLSRDRKHWSVEVFALTDRGLSVDCLAQQASSEELGDATRRLLGRICTSIRLPGK